jgi:predicted nucleic acid-binding protein
MAVNLSVQATVIDLRSDCPRPGDLFLVDTNAWLWQTYPNVSAVPKQPTQVARVGQKIREYSSYLQAARNVGSTLAYSGLILAELAHVIEKSEFEIYRRNNEPTRLSFKEYRHNLASERLNVVDLVELSWAQVAAIAVPINLAVNESVTQAALRRFQSAALDGYDLLIIEAAERERITQFVTDDMDYAVVSGIQMFTTNQDVISAAQAQGKLLVR